jgi:hypothetical protein
MKQVILSYLLFLACSTESHAQLGKVKINFPHRLTANLSYYDAEYKTEISVYIYGTVNFKGNYDSMNNERIRMNLNDDNDSVMHPCDIQPEDLNVIVDTNQEFKTDVYFSKTFKNGQYYSYPKYIKYKNRKGILKKQWSGKYIFKSFIGYPIYIANFSKENRYVLDVSGYIDIAQEAKDSAGNWVVIDSAAPPPCGMVRNLSTIHSHQSLITSVLKYKGSYRTLLRVRFVDDRDKVYYSEPYYGYIDYKQIYNPKVKIIDGELYQ